MYFSMMYTDIVEDKFIVISSSHDGYRDAPLFILDSYRDISRKNHMIVLSRYASLLEVTLKL